MTNVLPLNLFQVQEIIILKGSEVVQRTLILDELNIVAVERWGH